MKDPEEETKQPNLNSTFNQGTEEYKNEIVNDIDLSNWSPNSNILKDNIASSEIFDTKEP